MSKTIIAEGRTTNEAIENGLKELKVSKELVNIKVLESDDKRSFFSILAPRVVKVEMTLKDEVPKKDINVKREINLSIEKQEKVKQNVDNFLRDLIKELPEGTKYVINTDKTGLSVELNNENLGYLIGYRGETLYDLQNILSAIASKGIDEKVRVILDIEGYRAKRDKTLKELADKVAKTVIRTRKPITLEPMKPYERKVIHTRLQENTKIDTTSIGEEPFRRIVISLRKK